MTLFIYSIATFFMGILLHLFFSGLGQWVPFTPSILVLLTIALGFSVGPFSGQLFGFFWGFFLDMAGIYFLGMHAFLFTILGYLSGVLRKRVASDQWSAQLALALTGTVVVLGGSHLLSALFSQPLSFQRWHLFLFHLVFNVAAIRPVFSLIEAWEKRWPLRWGKM